MNTARIPHVRSDRFHFELTADRRGGMFTAEASDLGTDFNLGRVYDDAADGGFAMVSVATGKVAVFVESDHVRDAEGELLYTDFVLTPRSARDLRLDGRSSNVTVRLFND